MADAEAGEPLIGDGVAAAIVPDEVFTLATQIVAVDGPMAVVRAEVGYSDPLTQEYRDLWLIRLGADGRCSWFEEWPFWPEQPFAASP